MITNAHLDTLIAEPQALSDLIAGGHVEVHPEVIRVTAELAEMALEVKRHRLTDEQIGTLRTFVHRQEHLYPTTCSVIYAIIAAQEGP